MKMIYKSFARTEEYSLLYMMISRIDDNFYASFCRHDDILAETYSGAISYLNNNDLKEFKKAVMGETCISGGI